VRGTPINAYDLQDALKAPGKRIAPSTVYRTLDFLIRQRLVVHRINTLNAYVACTESHEDDQARHYPFMLVCSLCERSVEINDDSLYGLIYGDKDTAVFFAQAESIEIQGVCKHCFPLASAGQSASRERIS
jgi:Fur family zinc uptake transcriptional regulator